MGIPGMFKSLLIKQKTQALLKSIDRLRIASVSIDLNGLLHKAFALIYTESLKSKGEKLIKEGQRTKNKTLIKEGKDLVAIYDNGVALINQGNTLINEDRIEEGEEKVREGTNIIEQRVFIKKDGLSQDLLDKLEDDYKSKLWQLIVDVVNEFKPTHTLVLAVDGVSNMAKMKQQRQRRFKSALNNDALHNFDSNVITPGTEFMIMIDQFLRHQLTNFNYMLPNKVIYSSHLVEGEGEHKIFSYFREGEMRNMSGHHIVYGLDADLIMLSLLSPQSNIILSRESQGDAIDIERLKIYITNTMRNKHSVKDFVIIMYLLGNDFLPHQISLDRMDDTIVLLMNIYAQNHLNYNFTDHHNEFNIPNFSKYLNELAKNEIELLTNLSNRNDYESKALTVAKRGNKLDLNSYRESYYDKVFNGAANDTKITAMVHAYIKTMAWNFLYYNEGPKSVNKTWCYHYYYTPMLVDLSFYIDNVDIRGYKRYNGMLEYNALHQLLTVLPKTSVSIVPEEIKDLFYINSPIYDLFPSKFVNDHEGRIPKLIAGRQQIDHGIAIIPIPDQQRIIDIVNTLTIDKERLKLWQPHNDLILVKKPMLEPQPQFTATLNPTAREFVPTFLPTFKPTSSQFVPSQKSTTLKPTASEFVPTQKTTILPITLKPTASEFVPTQKPTTLKPTARDFVPTKPQVIDEHLPPMINLGKIEEYIKTGKIYKSVREQLFEENWY